MNDLKFACRQLLKNPGFTAVAVLTLALGIGASVAIFSVVNIVILNPLPGPQPDRLIQIGERSHGNMDEPMFGGLTTAAIEILKTKQEFFSDVVWMEGLYLERKTEDFIEGIGGTAVSPNFFAQWNIKPVLGRTFAKDEAARRIDYKSLDGDTVMVVSDSLWQSRFGGQTDVLGKTIEANGRHFTMLAAIGLVLLIACVNVANLMLARTEKRQHELAIRAAVGAGKMRLLRQLLTESVFLACIGAVGGLVVTLFGMELLVALIPESIPRLRAIQTDAHVLAVALVLSVGTALAFGLVPAWHASRTSVGNALKRSGAGATISAGWRRYRSALVVVEVALSLLLLTGAGLMMESVIRLLHVNPGFDPDSLLLVHPGLLRGEKYYASERSAEVHSALFDELHERFSALPGVKAVGISKLSGFRPGYAIEGMEKPIGLLRAGTGVGASDLFRAMGIPIRSGRPFDKTDIGNQVGTVIVNET